MIFMESMIYRGGGDFLPETSKEEARLRGESAGEQERTPAPADAGSAENS